MLGKSCLAVIAIPALVAMAAPAYAETIELAAGPVYGGKSIKKPDSSYAGFVTCRLFNNGAVAHITSRKIFDNTNAAVTLDGGDSCTGALGHHKYCAFAATIGGNFAFTCAVTVSPATASIVGVAEILDSNSLLVGVVPFSR